MGPGREDGLAVRPAKASDVEAIARTLKAAFTPLAPLYTASAFAATVPPAGDLAARLAMARTWVAVRRQVVVGTVTARPTQTGMYVQSMAVLPEARGSGVGRRLLAAVVGFAEESRSPRLYLSTTPFLKEAIGLYESCGFSFVPNEGPFDLHGTPLLTMERRLAALRA